MASWRDNLRPASLGGLAFEVDGHGASFGRRLVLHEFPGSEASSVEDLGRKAYRGDVEGFLVGSDYMARRDRLRELCETEGPHELVHPYLGSLKVHVEDFRPGEVKEEGNLCRFTISVIEDRRNAFATIVSSAPAEVIAAAETAEAASKSVFESALDTASNLAYVAAQAINDVTAKTAAVTAAIRGPHAAMIANIHRVANAVAALDAALTTLVDLPGDLADQYKAVLDLTTDALSSLGHTVGRMAVWRAFVENLDPDTLVAASATTVGDIQVAGNTAAIQQLVYGLGLAQWGRAAGGEPFAFESAEDAEAAADAFGDACQALLEAADDPSIYEAYADLRGAVRAAIDEVIATLPRRRTYTPAGPTNAFQIAHDVLGDASRVDEILALNIIPHPGWMGVNPITVLAPA